jgi:hypothetical protein
MSMARFRYSDLVLELVELCHEVKKDLQQRLRYYRASAYKMDAARPINERVDQLRAIFDILSDDDLAEALADHDAIMDCGPQMLQAGECSVTARVGVLIAAMDPALNALVRRHGNSQSQVRVETIKALHRHRSTLMNICREGSRSWELLRGL